MFGLLDAVQTPASRQAKQGHKHACAHGTLEANAPWAEDRTSVCTEDEGHNRRCNQLAPVTPPQNNAG